MIALTFEQSTTIFGITMTILGVIVQAFYLVRRFTQFEVQTRNDIAGMSAATKSSMEKLESSTSNTIAHHNEMSRLRLEDLGGRIGRVETKLDGITKVVVFPEGK